MLMEELLHQLIWQISHYYKLLYIPGGAGFRPSTVVALFFSSRLKGGNFFKAWEPSWRFLLETIMVLGAMTCYFEGM